MPVLLAISYIPSMLILVWIEIVMLLFIRIYVDIGVDLNGGVVVYKNIC